MDDSCTPVQNLIAQYVDGKLSKDEERIVLDHVRRCKGCQEDVKASRFLTDVLRRGLDLPDPPADLAQGILRSVQRR